MTHEQSRRVRRKMRAQLLIRIESLLDTLEQLPIIECCDHPSAQIPDPEKTQAVCENCNGVIAIPQIMTCKQAQQLINLKQLMCLE